MRHLKTITLFIALALVALLFFAFISDDFSVPVVERTIRDIIETTPSEEGQDETTPTSPTQPTSSANDFGPVGAMNHQYLQAEPFDRLVIEVDNAEGTSPRDSALNYMMSQFSNYADKPQGIARGGDNTFPAQKDSYTENDLVNIARQNRNNFSGSGDAVMHIIYLNGTYEPNESALAAAINATTIVLFQQQINRASTLPFLTASYERAVLVHEMGHLWGLVNINYKSATDHEDPNYPYHSSNSGSVMYWAVESLAVRDIFAGGPPDTFDSADEADIENIKLGNY